MVEMNDISFGYSRKKMLFSGLNLDIPKGSIIGLLGRNGEGKSTLMKLITGQLLAQMGTIQTLGYEASERAVGMLQQVYMLPEEVVLPRMSIRKYFEIIAPLYPTYDSEMAEVLIRDFDLSWDMHLGKISLGQKKKAAIVLALSLRTPLLLLDEPTNGLDIPSKSVFRRILAGYIGADQTVIISTHQVRDLEQLIDRLILLDDNRIVCNDSIDHLSQMFYFGMITPEALSEPLYREYSAMGEAGIWRAEQGYEGDNFSMELFFNAMVNARELMQRIISAHSGNAQARTSQSL